MAVVLLLMGATACSFLPIKPQKGGGATVGPQPAAAIVGVAVKSTLGALIPPQTGDQPPVATITQPENAQGSSGQSTAFKKVSEVTVPSPYVETYETVTPEGVKTVVTKTFPAGTVKKDSVESSVVQDIGGSWKDVGREIAAKLGSFKWIQGFGLLFILGAVAMFHPVVRIAVGAGKQMQAMTALAGVVLTFGPALVVGHETEILLVVVAGLFVYFISNRLAHKEGQLDLLNSQNNENKPNV